MPRLDRLPQINCNTLLGLPVQVNDGAAGQLLRRVRERLDASDDKEWKAAAFGVAR